MKTKTFNEKPLKKFSPIKAYYGVLFTPCTLITNIKCFSTIIWEFFLLQFLEKFRILRIPIVHVDHPLDKKIPFTPKKVTVYLDFINFWVRPLSMLVSKFGIWKASLLAKKWMFNFRKLYKCSAQIYRFRLSTTDRPDYNEMLEFRQIHALDPHYLCVPSLHVATVALGYGFYRKMFQEEEFSAEEIQNWTKELYAGALEIAETVLYVKQHSVNCIPAALYMVTANFSEFFTEEDARKFIAEMFEKPEGFTTTDSEEIRTHIKNAYENYISESKKTEKWYQPVHDFLLNYENSIK